MALGQLKHNTEGAMQDDKEQKNGNTRIAPPPAETSAKLTPEKRVRRWKQRPPPPAAWLLPLS